VLIRKKAEYLGRAHARTADDAFKVAIREREITDPEKQKLQASSPLFVPNSTHPSCLGQRAARIGRGAVGA